jgi:branched-chain amino acid transport system permease protein
MTEGVVVERGGGASDAVAWIREHAEAGILAAVLLSIVVLPGILGADGMPLGLYGFGLVGGAALAMQAIGVILVYRSNRIINFAQVQVGAVAATFFVAMIQLVPLARLLGRICPPCLAATGEGFATFNFYFSLILALGLSVLLAYLIYFVARRFADAPRLVLTVATIFIAQLLAGFQGALPTLLASEFQREGQIQLGAATLPFDFSFRISGTTFQAHDILMLAAAVVAVVLLTRYLRSSRTGIAIRASSENPDRAETLGISTSKVTGRIWLIAGLLSGIVGILTAMSIGAGTEATLSVGGLVRILAVAVFARLVGLPLAILTAAVLGIGEQAVFWFWGSITPFEGLLFVLIGVALLLQRYRSDRGEVVLASGWRAAREIRPIPRELRGLPVVKRWLRIGAVAGGVAVIGFPWAMSPSQTNLAAVTMIFGMVVLSLLILTGWAGQISLGQFAFAAIGGYTAALVPLPLLLRLILAGLAGAAAALVVGLPALKMRGLHLAITTLAFALATSAVLLNPNYLGQALPTALERPSFLGFDLEDQRVFYYSTLALLALVVTAVAGLRRSRTARALIAARDNEEAAQSFGINLVGSRLIAFAISGFIAALAGALFAFHQHGVQAIAFAPEVSVRMFLITVIGGLGAVSAPLIGVALFHGVLTLISTNPLVGFLATGGGGLLLLLVAPGGLAQMIFDVRDTILRSIARRQRIVVPSLLADVKVDAGVIRERHPIAPKARPGGGAAFVPRRYEVAGQWALSGKAQQPDGEDAAREEEDVGTH